MGDEYKEVYYYFKKVKWKQQIRSAGKDSLK